MTRVQINLDGECPFNHDVGHRLPIQHQYGEIISRYSPVVALPWYGYWMADGGQNIRYTMRDSVSLNDERHTVSVQLDDGRTFRYADNELR